MFLQRLEALLHTKLIRFVSWSSGTTTLSVSGRFITINHYENIQREKKKWVQNGSNVTKNSIWKKILFPFQCELGFCDKNRCKANEHENVFDVMMLPDIRWNIAQFTSLEYFCYDVDYTNITEKNADLEWRETKEKGKSTLSCRIYIEHKHTHDISTARFYWATEWHVWIFNYSVARRTQLFRSFIISKSQHQNIHTISCSMLQIEPPPCFEYQFSANTWRKNATKWFTPFSFLGWPIQIKCLFHCR